MRHGDRQMEGETNRRTDRHTDRTKELEKRSVEISPSFSPATNHPQDQVPSQNRKELMLKGRFLVGIKQELLEQIHETTTQLNELQRLQLYCNSHHQGKVPHVYFGRTNVAEVQTLVYNSDTTTNTHQPNLSKQFRGEETKTELYSIYRLSTSTKFHVVNCCSIHRSCTSLTPKRSEVELLNH